ncbi:MAG: galactokinase [Planctomycetes bacterium]|nr:galactokinase [Planctomycetota bacterium]
MADWRDQDATREWLETHGLSPNGALSKAALFAQAAQRLLESNVPDSTPTVGCYCPGRLEVLGKHTDYAGGRSLIAAPEIGITALACVGESGQLKAHSLQAAQTVSVDLRGADSPRGWGLYPTTVLRRLTHNFPRFDLGLHLTCASDLPLAAGMSSSSALMTATLLCALKLFDLDADPRLQSSVQTPEERAYFASCVENGNSFGEFEGDPGVGTFGGSEDHTAMFTGRTNHLSQFGFAPILHERSIAIPKDLTFLVAQSGVAAEKTAGALQSYNRLSLMVRELERQARAQGLGTTQQTLAQVLRAHPEHGARLEHALQTATDLRYPAEDLTRRLRHFQLESEKLISMWPADWTRAHDALIGDLAAQSTGAAQDLLANQVPETLALTEALLEAGALAASPFGAGFGGSVWALIQDDQADSLVQQFQTQEAQPIPLGPAATCL